MPLHLQLELLLRRQLQRRLRCGWSSWSRCGPPGGGIKGTPCLEGAPCLERTHRTHVLLELGMQLCVFLAAYLPRHLVSLPLVAHVLPHLFEQPLVRRVLY